MGLIDLFFILHLPLEERGYMEKIILGYLMICGMSAYDLKTSIRKNMSSMCSSSAGSIHSALKKLLEHGLIAEELSEQFSRDKKIYSITEQGRVEFLNWVNEPMKLEKAKNIELAKMFFAGMQSKEARIVSIKKYVENLENELAELLQIENASKEMSAEGIQQFQKRLSLDSYNVNGIKSLGDNEVSLDMISDIYNNQMLTLSYGIAQAKFQIQWYKNMISEMESE